MSLLYCEGGGNLTPEALFWAPHRQKGRAVFQMGEQPGKGPESGGNLGPSRNFQLLGRLERQSPGFRSLAGPVGPGEGCRLWLMTVGTGEAEEVMAGSIFQMLRESWVPSYRMGCTRRWGAGLYSPEDWRGVQHRSLKDHHGLLCGLCPAQNTSKRMGWRLKLTLSILAHGCGLCPLRGGIFF